MWINTLTFIIFPVVGFFLVQKYVLMIGVPIFVIVKVFSTNYHKGLIINKITEERIESFLLGKKYCTLHLKEKIQSTRQ